MRINRSPPDLNGTNAGNAHEDGGVSRATLTRLLSLVNVEREDFVDPGLAAVLDEIELRARVELAKLNFEAAG
jgi:hypothetical protein